MTHATSELSMVLALLDDGISLYRRNFVPFLLIAAIWCIPIAIATGLIVVAASWASEAVAMLLIFAALIAAIPLSIYLLSGLSRAAMAAIDQRPIQLRESFAIHPLRACGIACFLFVHGLITSFVAGGFNVICFCMLYALSIPLLGGILAVDSSPATGLLILIAFFMSFVAAYAAILTASSAATTSMIYGLQPWVQTRLAFGEAFQHSFDLLGFHFRRNLMVWSATGVLTAAVGTIVTTTIGSLVPLLLAFVVQAESELVQAVSASSWMIGLIVVLPPLPIWMALYYRRSLMEREGIDLAARVAAWQAAAIDQPSHVEVHSTVDPASA